MCNIQHELSQLLSTPRMLGERYSHFFGLSLHPKPACAQLFSGISYAGTRLHQTASSEYWHGRVVRAIANLVVVTGYSINMIVALGETISSLTAALFFATAYFITCSRSVFLFKHTVKALSYCLNSIGIIAAESVMIFLNVFAKYHSINSLASNVTQLFSASVVLGLLKEPHNASFMKGVHTFIEDGPLLDLLYSLDRDFGEGATVEEFKQQLKTQSILNFSLAYPTHKQVITDMGIANVFHEAYQTRCISMARDFVYFSYHPDSRQQLPIEVVVNRNTAQVQAYQAVLDKYIKIAFKEIYNNPALTSYLSHNRLEKEGKEALGSFLAEIYLPLSHYVQLLELENEEIVCPHKFSHARLQAYNKRSNELLAARELLKALPKEYKPVLIEKLLSVQVFTPEIPNHLKGLFDNLVRKIDTLASSLYMGALMSLPTRDGISGHNLFHKACQEALKEI